MLYELTVLLDLSYPSFKYPEIYMHKTMQKINGSHLRSNIAPPGYFLTECAHA